MLFRKNNARIFLGDITVVKNSNLKNTLSLTNSSSGSNPVQAIEQALTDLIDLPSSQERRKILPDDRALDIIVPEYNFGELSALDIGQFTAPLAWRPEILMTGKLYEINTNKTIHATTIRHRPGWPSWIKQSLSLHNISGMNPKVTDEDMHKLTLQAGIKLLIGFRKYI